MLKNKLLFTAAFLVLHLLSNAQIRLPKLISDGMVLQRDVPVKIWGWASNGEAIEMSFNQNTFKAKADKTGYWEIKLPKQKAGGPYEMLLKGKNEIKIKDILFGDVWLCSGQSNMELPMYRVRTKYPEELKSANNSEIRQFKVHQTYNFNTPQTDLKSGDWKPVSPKNIADFSAVAYFFAKELYAREKVPIGILNSALGGSPAEAWTDEEHLKKFPHYLKEAYKFRNQALIDSIQASDRAASRKWYSELFQKDEGYKGKNWSQLSEVDDNWKEFTVPGIWRKEPLKSLKGSVWTFKNFEVKAEDAGKAAFLNLGVLVDADSVFINGKCVGNITYRYPPRWYNIPEGVLKAGKNHIMVRLVCNAGNGGFTEHKPYEIKTENNVIDLKGTWKYRIAAKMDRNAPGQTFIRWKPLGLYNAMIHPLTNYSIKGAVWYQGESNVGKYREYGQLLPIMIEGWRENWNQGDFPFIIIQLANYLAERSKPAESSWAALREAQRKTAQLKNSALVSILDIGEWNDIHPLNKGEVGRRVALAAEKIAYGKQLVHSGPEILSAKQKGEKIILKFDTFGSKLKTRDGKAPLHFAVAATDGKFVWAKAKIKGNTVELSCAKGSKVKRVRYAWADNPATANLCNNEGLPASSFEIEVK